MDKKQLDESRFRELHAEGLSDMDIAEALLGNREKNSGQRVTRLRTALGLSPNKAKRGPKADTSLDEELAQLYADGMTCDQIAERVRRKSSWVYSRLVSLGLHEGRFTRGRYGKSNAVPDDLAQVWRDSFRDKPSAIRGVIHQGSAQRVAQHYGVSPETANKWLKSTGLLQNRLNGIDTWASLYRSGVSCEAIGVRFGMRPETISRYLKAQGVEVKNGYSYQEQQVADFVSSLGVTVQRHNRTLIAPKELDIYCPDQKVAVEYNGVYWHSAQFKDAGFHLGKTTACEGVGVRLIHVWEHLWVQPHKRPIYENMIRHALGLTGHRLGARQTRVEKRTASSMRSFFEENNIQGYRQAKWAYVLVDKKTGLDLMCYTTGHAYFGKGIYDLEIARGACRLGYSVSGGATKLWKEIIADNPEANSIVYYVDLNHYSGSSVSVLPGVSFVKTQTGFWNWFTEEAVMRNREPARHAEITAGYKDGSIVQVHNAGTAVYVWRRPAM